jgi:hypothetical protein
MENTQAGIEEGMTDDALFLSVLEAVQLLNVEIDGGLAAYADAAKHKDLDAITIAAEEARLTQQKLLEMKNIIFSACDEFEKKSFDTKDAKNVLIAQHCRNTLLAYVDKLELPCPDKGATAESIKESSNSRRKLLSMLGLGLGGVAIAGGMAMPQKAMALGDSAATVPYLSKMLLEAKKMYDIAVEELNRIKDLNQGMQAVNNAFVRGIDGLLVHEQEESTKQIVAQATAADRQVNTMVELEKTKMIMGSNPGTTPCSADAAGVVTNELSRRKKQATAQITEKNVAAALDDSARNDSVDEGRDIHKDLNSGDLSGMNGSQLSQTSFNGQNREVVISRDKLKRRMLAEPSVIPKGRIEQSSKTSKGLKNISDAAIRYVRRSTADGTIQELDQSLRGSGDAFKKMETQISSVSSTDVSDIPDGQAAVLDSRLIAYGSDLTDLLRTVTEGTETLSLLETLEFQVKSKDLPSFHEFVRSTGNEPAPLLRELINMESLSLKIEYERLIQARNQSALLSNILLEMQDSPDRIKSILHARKKI